MTDLFRKQLLRARKKLEDPAYEVETEWFEQLLGSEAVKAVSVEINRLVDAETRHLCLKPPQPPRSSSPDLSEEGVEYWNEILRLKDSEPAAPRVFRPSRTAKPRRQKFKMPKRLLLYPGGLVGFKPKLNKRELFIARVVRHAHKFDELDADERAKFTMAYGPLVGGLRLPHPKVFADQERFRVESEGFHAQIRKLRSKATLEAWRAAFDKALGRGTGTYKVGGRVVGMECRTEGQQNDR